MGAVRLSDGSRASMRSPINWALLGLLIRRPSYGYELTQRFERAFPGTLELSSRSQIYTAIDSLARRGLIEGVAREEGEGQVRQPRLRYRPTGAGIAAYEQWLVGQVSDDGSRSLLLSQHVAALGPEHALKVLEQCAEVCLQAASGLPDDREGEGGQESGDEDPGRAGALAERLAGEERRLRAGAILSWIEYARSELNTGKREPER